MTNEEAKKIIKAKLECLKRETSGTDINCNSQNCDECNLCYEQGNNGEQKEALTMAIKALEQTSEDCISRQAVEEITWEEPSYTDALNVLTEVRDKIRQLPSVTPQQKIGQWIFHKPFENGHKNCNECIECSQCHTWFGCNCYAKTSYCPNCGAKMEEVEK